MRLWLASALVVSFVALAHFNVRGQEGDNLPASDPDELTYQENKQKKREEVLAARKLLEAKVAETARQLEDDRKKLAERQEVVATVDDHEVKCLEPRSMEDVLNTLDPKPNRMVRDEYEVSPDDFIIDVHDRWSLSQADFRFDPPQYISYDTVPGHTKKWFGIPVTITNSTGKKRRISPQFTACTNNGVINSAVGGFVPERLMAHSMLRPLAGSNEFRDQDLLSQRVAPLESVINMGAYALDAEKGTSQLSPLATFEPGQTRWGAALWTNFSDEFTELKIVVHGLTNAHRYEEKQERVLVLTFTRNDDEFNVQRTELKFKEKHFDYLWMWDQCINVPFPGDAKDPQIKVQVLQTPAGASKLAWAFPFVVNNPARVAQDISIASVSYICKVQVEIGGVKVPVEVRVVDDGRSTIYKTQVLKALGKETIKDRYQFGPIEESSKTLVQKRKITLEPGKGLDETWAIFDEADVDWDDVRLQVETALTLQLDKKAVSAQTRERAAKPLQAQDKDILKKNPGILCDPRRRLSDEEAAQVKEQIVKALPAALDEAKAKKVVTAEFDCTCGMATGTRRISRSYAKPGVVDEGWLSDWETWYKEWEAGEPEAK